VIDRLVGEGGMATVYLARDVKHNRKVALKVLKPDLGAVVGVDRFLAEIQVTANLQHPNLLPLFDSGAAGGLLFHVMPYVEGESLRARLELAVAQDVGATSEASVLTVIVNWRPGRRARSDEREP
jgi:serine/threonine-protein kinase